MHAPKTLLVAFLAGIVLLIFLAGVLLSGFSAALASMGGTGTGFCQPASTTPGATPSATLSHAGMPSPQPTGTAPVCVPPGGVGKQVVALGAGDGGSALCEPGLSRADQLSQLLLHVV